MSFKLTESSTYLFPNLSLHTGFLQHSIIFQFTLEPIIHHVEYLVSIPRLWTLFFFTVYHCFQFVHQKDPLQKFVKGKFSQHFRNKKNIKQRQIFSCWCGGGKAYEYLYHNCFALTNTTLITSPKYNLLLSLGLYISLFFL